MKHSQNKLKIVNRIFSIVFSLTFTYDILMSILMYILGEEIVIGNTVLNALFDATPYIFIADGLWYGIAVIIIRRREKKNPQFEDGVPPQTE